MCRCSLSSRQPLFADPSASRPRAPPDRRSSFHFHLLESCSLSCDPSNSSSLTASVTVVMSADSKLDRAAAHAKQAARHTEDRAKKLQAPTAVPQPNSGKRGGGSRPALNLGDEEDDGYDQSLGDSIMSSGTDASQTGSPETRTTHVPLGEMVEAAKVEAAKTRTHRSGAVLKGCVALTGR